ncbi:MAG: YitT family protein [Bacilli bacterium]
MIFKKKSKKINDILQIDFSKKSRLRRYIELIIGVFLLALAFNLFMLPNKIISGFSGVAIILNDLFRIDASLFIFIVTVVLLIVGIFTLGKDKIRSTVCGALLYPFFIKVTEPLISYFVIENSEALLLVIFGGFVSGIGTGLVFRAGFSTGGSDTVVQIINKYFKVSLGRANIILNVIIIISGVFIFGWTKLMYSLLFLYIVSIVMDRVILGISNSKSFYIITEYEDDIKTYIMKKLQRGVTAIEARGGFTNNKQKILMCIVPTREYFMLKEVINEIDPNAVILITDVYEAHGSR